MTKEKDRKIVLEDGSEYCGYGFGDNCDKICEIVFNTSMVGYQEILSDPSYTYQMVVMTYPLIGNYGITDEDFEANTVSGWVIESLGEIPTVGKTFTYENLSVEVLKSTVKKVLQIRVLTTTESEEE